MLWLKKVYVPCLRPRRAMHESKQAKARDVYWQMHSKVTKVGDGSTNSREIASKALRVMERLAKSDSLADEQREQLVHVKVILGMLKTIVSRARAQQDRTSG